jgi:hypothetical protein
MLDLCYGKKHPSLNHTKERERERDKQSTRLSFVQKRTTQERRRRRRRRKFRPIVL